MQAAFYADPRVLTISLHQHPATLFPFTGLPAEAYPGYRKTTDGPLIIADAGLDSIRRCCQHTDSWLREIETRLRADVPDGSSAFRRAMLRILPLRHCGLSYGYAHAGTCDSHSA